MGRGLRVKTRPKYLDHYVEVGVCEFNYDFLFCSSFCTGKRLFWNSWKPLFAELKFHFSTI